MSVRFTIDGLDALRAELRKLPAELTAEAGHLIEGKAADAAVAVRAGYGAHRDSGNLQDHVVVVKRAAGRFGVAFEVRSTARHAYIFDNGSEARHYITQNGVRHLTGKMPPRPVFIPALVHARHRMYEGLRGVLTRAGLQVRDA